MEALRTALAHFVNHVTQTAGVYTSVIVIFVFHVVLHKDLPCSCKEQRKECWFYMIVPACLIFLFVLWVDKTFQTALKYSCRAGYESHYCVVLRIRVLKAVCIGLLWAVSVLLDGDWFICCQNNETDHQQLACKDEANNTADELRIRNQLAGTSMFWGLLTLLIIVLVAALLSSIQANYKKKNRSHQIILEEGENLMTKKLKEAVKDKVTKKLNQKNKTWGECFDVIDDVGEKILSEKTAVTCLLDNTQSGTEDS